jgi:hypothetical protein
LQEGHVTGLRFCVLRRQVHEDANTPHTLALLRARYYGPRRRRAAEQRDELAPVHSISLVNADQSFCGDASDGRTRPAQLQDASNRQANDDESAD